MVSPFLKSMSPPQIKVDEYVATSDRSKGLHTFKNLLLRSFFSFSGNVSASKIQTGSKLRFSHSLPQLPFSFSLFISSFKKLPDLTPKHHLKSVVGEAWPDEQTWAKKVVLRPENRATTMGWVFRFEEGEGFHIDKYEEDFYTSPEKQGCLPEKQGSFDEK